MLREKLTMATSVLLFFSILVAASCGMWLFLQPAFDPEGAGGTFLGLAPHDVLSILMALSLVNLLLLAGYLSLHWPVLAAGAAALLPNPTGRGLATSVAALGALVLLSLPWLAPRSVPPIPPLATETPAPPVATPAPIPTPLTPERRVTADRSASPANVTKQQKKLSRPKVASHHSKVAYRRPTVRQTWTKKPRHTCPRFGHASQRWLARSY